jgi:NAD(P)-dependent dehydrogenase (short-subunit alcohol dehydrogenase family)
MRILITGAGSGIGAATATVLAAAGHDVVATARDVSLLEALPVGLRLPMDVTDQRSVAEAVGAAEAAGALDAVVNNAAISGKGPMETFPLDRLQSIFETNVIGPLRLIQQVLPTWRQRGSGVIINVSSIQGRIGTPLEGPYSASKFALEGLSEALHHELGHFGIRVVIVEPGYTGSGMKATDNIRGDAAYDDLWRQWSGTDAKVTGQAGRSEPASVAEAIRSAIEDPTTPLRVPVGPDSTLVLGARQAMDDASFEQAMRDVTGITW